MTDLPHLPPQDLAAERELLGACLLDGTVLEEAGMVLDPPDFYRTQHQRFWRAMVAGATTGQAADPVAMEHWLRTHGAYVAGDLADLADLWKDIILPREARACIPRLLTASVTRALILLATHWIEMAYRPGQEAEALCLRIGQDVQRLSHRLAPSGLFRGTVAERG